MRRSTRERAEHENERVDDRRPPSITCGEGSAKLTGAEDVIMEREGSGGGGVRRTFRGMACHDRLWSSKRELACCKLRVVVRKHVPSRRALAICRHFSPLADLGAAHLHLDRKKLFQVG